MSENDRLEPPPFRIARPAERALPVVFASPHSGRLLPNGFHALTDLCPAALHRSEDSHVDRLFARVPRFGAPLLTASWSRVLIDLNRAADELDTGMIRDLPLGLPIQRTDRVAAGLGLVPRIAGRGEPIYRQPLPYEDVRRRIEDVYRPYHKTLAELMRETAALFGHATLIDCHSMPAAPRLEADIVLGDRFGASCDPALTSLVENRFRAAGYRVLRNLPYAGGYCTARWGQPHAGTQALQIEIRRDLYMNEEDFSLQGGADRLIACIDELLADFRAFAGFAAEPKAAE